MAVKVLFLTATGAGTWTVPADWSSTNKVETIAAGGGGRVATTGGGGGGGGAYSSVSNIATLAPTNVVNFSVGAGGAAGVTGGDTWFGATTLAASLVGAKGGVGATTSTGAAGGASASGFPAAGGVRNSGGAGGLGSATIFTGGGGGGAGGPGGVGGLGGAGDATATGADFGGGGGGGAGLAAVGNPGGAGTTTAGLGGAAVGGSGKGGDGGAGPGVSAAAGTGIWTSTHLPDATTASVVAAAPGGGGGGGGSATVGTAGNGTAYGGGGGGRGETTGGTSQGGNGLVVITYTAVGLGTGTLNDQNATTTSAAISASIGSDNSVQQATNIVLQSSTFASPWAVFSSGSGLANYLGGTATAPDSTATAVIWSVTRSSTADYAELYQTVPTTAVPHTASMWLKADGAGDVGKQITLTLNNGATLFNPTTVTLTNAWVRYTCTGTGFGGDAIVFGYLGGTGSQTGLVTFQTWGPQVELGSVATPYIPTAGAAVTRPASGGTVTAAATISGTGFAGVLPATATGALVDLVATVAGAGASASLITDTTINVSPAVVASIGVVRSVATGAPAAQAAVVASTTGLSRSIATPIALAAQRSGIAGVGVGAVITGTGVVTTRPALVSGAGLIVSAGVGAVQVSVAAVDAHGVSAWIATAANLNAAWANIDGLGEIPVNTVVSGPHAQVGDLWEGAAVWGKIAGKWRRLRLWTKADAAWGIASWDQDTQEVPVWSLPVYGVLDARGAHIAGSGFIRDQIWGAGDLVAGPALVTDSSSLSGLSVITHAAWEPTPAWVKVNGKWRRATMWTNVSEEWKRVA